MRHLVFVVPDDIPARFHGLNVYTLTRHVAAMPARPPQPGRLHHLDGPRELGRRALTREQEADRLDDLVEPIIADHASELLGVFGAGPFVAAILAGSPLVGSTRRQWPAEVLGRLRDETAWAHLCGLAPIPAISGRPRGPYRLKRGGNRQANSALHRIVLVRMGHHEPTRVYGQAATR